MITHTEGKGRGKAEALKSFPYMHEYQSSIARTHIMEQRYGDMHLNPSTGEAETVSSGSLTSHPNLMVEPQASERLCLKI